MRLALEKSTARFSLTFRGANEIGGNAPKDALAKEESRARLLKNPPDGTESSQCENNDRISYHSSKLYNHKCFLF